MRYLLFAPFGLLLSCGAATTDELPGRFASDREWGAYYRHHFAAEYCEWLAACPSDSPSDNAFQDDCVEVMQSLVDVELAQAEVIRYDQLESCFTHLENDVCDYGVEHVSRPWDCYVALDIHYR